MLHEILLSLSGYPSPLFCSATAPESHGSNSFSSMITAPERALLANVAHLSDLHIRLRSFSAQAAHQHPSAICRAVATSIENVHLAAFQRIVLEVEESILKEDAELVGAYNIVPLTAVVAKFGGWTRRMEWLWEVVEFALKRGHDEKEKEMICTGAALIDWLRGGLQTGYVDVEEVARGLAKVAEVAWIKQVSAWVLYGRLPGFGAGDFFIQKTDEVDEQFACVPSLLPSFVTAPTAASMLFIGRSLTYIRAQSSLDGGIRSLDHLSSQLRHLSELTYPLDSATFARTITGIRLFLSRTTLQKLLPLSKVLELLQLLRDFFLLGRGEFTMALTRQADERIRSRWHRADNLASEKHDDLINVHVKEGELATVLTHTWAAMGSMQGQQAEVDEGLELARDLLRLKLVKSNSSTPIRPTPNVQIASTPFRNLMYSVPVALTLHLPSPLDLFLTQSDVNTYSAIHSYLHSLRRAHLRLTDLWKITSLRRHHPAPPKPSYGMSQAGRAHVKMLRERQSLRMLALRSVWTTCSAAIFFLAELEGYLQIEVVAELWEGFQRWLTTGSDEYRPPETTSRPASRVLQHVGDDGLDEDDGDTDLWLVESSDSAPQPQQSQSPNHDPQTLAIAHKLYLASLTHRILLSHQPFTDPLYSLLVEINQLVALVHRLQDIWNAADLEADVGVIDAFVDLEAEECAIRTQMGDVVERVKGAIGGVIKVLRDIGADWEEDGGGDEGPLREEGQYVPRRVGSVDRLLMKLEYGSWFEAETADGS